MQNLRYAFRVFSKRPLFTAIVIFTFALGIGANTAVFSVLNAVLLRPLPFHEPQNLVALGEFDIREKADPGTEIQSISYLDYVDFRDQGQAFDRIAVYTNQAVSTLTDGNQATHIQGESVSANLFQLLGVQPMLGRTFLPNEDEPGNRVVILSHGLWQRQFGGDSGIIGKNVTLDGQQFQVIGVMPPRFTFPIGSNPPELWIPMSNLRQTQKDGSPPMTEQRDNDFFQCVARLKPNVSMQQAQANIDTLVANWHQQYPELKLHAGAKVIPEIYSMISSGTHSALWMLCAMAGCVLLVACVNVANLLLARSLSRNREISIRAALGAGRWHIISQLILESVLLGVFGGLAGLLIAVWGIESLKTFLPNISRIDEISPDPRVLVFTALISLFVGIFAGLLPAWRAKVRAVRPNRLLAELAPRSWLSKLFSLWCCSRAPACSSKVFFACKKFQLVLTRAMSRLRVSLCPKVVIPSRRTPPHFTRSCFLACLLFPACNRQLRRGGFRSAAAKSVLTSISKSIQYRRGSGRSQRSTLLHPITSRQCALRSAAAVHLPITTIELRPR